MKPALDDVLYAPVRLQIGAFLARADEAEFAVLRDLADISDSVLSKHLSALSDAGYVSLRKAAREGRQRTWVSLTVRGRSAFRGHLQALQAMIAAADAKGGD